MTWRIKYYTILLLLGFYGYGLLEILWRGRTHPTMGLAGGLALISISYINNRYKHLNIIYRALLCGFAITIIELAIGYIMNIRLGANIWDYSEMPLNYRGQICLYFSVAWSLLSIPIMLLCDRFYKICVENHKIKQ